MDGHRTHLLLAVILASCLLHTATSATTATQATDDTTSTSEPSNVETSEVPTSEGEIVKTDSSLSTDPQQTETPESASTSNPQQTDAPESVSTSGPHETEAPDSESTTGSPVVETDSPDAGTTESQTTTPKVTTTTKPNASSDLTTTDTIIIGVTCGVAGLVLIGAIVYGCMKRSELRKERDEMYRKYLQYDAVHAASAEAGSVDNAGFEMGDPQPSAQL